MHVLLAYVNCTPTKSGVSFTWEGEFYQMSGSGRERLGKGGRLRGMIINDGDSSEFTAERSDEPDRPIQDPLSYRDK